MEPGARLAVSPGHVAGFGTSVGDFTDKFWELANKTMGSVKLPAGATGLLAGLVAPLSGFRDRASDAHQGDREALYKLSGGLSEAGRLYHGQDQGNVQALNIFGLRGTATSELEHAAWSGAQDVDVPGIASSDVSARQVVRWAIGVLSPFEEGLRNAAGIEPITDHLAPVDCDWGALQPLASHIGILGSNDQSLASNLGNGSKWLTENHWSGAASQAFTAASNTRRNSADERGAHMTGVAAVLRQGGQQVEQQARNQAYALVNDLMRPTTFEGFTLPLGLWGTILDRQMSEGIRAEIRGDLQAAHAAAASRHADILSTVQNMQSALQSESAQAITASSSDERSSAVSVSGQGRAGYRYGSYTWMEGDRDFRPAA